MSTENQDLVIFEHVKKSFVNQASVQLEVLKDVSFSLKKGTITGLIGPSGAGKSVLCKMMGGVLKPDGGVLRLSNLKQTQISLMFQEGALFDSFSVFDNVAFPLIHGAKSVSLEVAEKVYNILARVGLSKAVNKFPAQLSGGMRRRVSLARALVSAPELVILDDPTCGLDPVASGVIMELILELQRENDYTVVIVSQDLRRLIPSVQTLLALFHGKIVFDGSLERLKTETQTEILHFINCRYDLTTVAELN